MKVSVLYPICNDQRPNSLRSTIASAREALGDIDYEIIVCDDQSTDGCTRGLPKDVLVLRTHSRQGCTGSRKQLEKAATGDIIIWSDPHCRYPAGSFKKLALAAANCDYVIETATRSMEKGSTVTFGSAYKLSERGIINCKTSQPHPVHPGLLGTVYAAKRSVFDSVGGWPHLPGYWGCADTTLSFLLWVAGVQTVVVTDITCIHKYSPNRRFCFSTEHWHHAANAHWFHASLFPKTYKTFWRPLLLKHEKWSAKRVMAKVDEQLKSRRFRQFAALVEKLRLPDRTEEECCRQLLGDVPNGMPLESANEQTNRVLVTREVVRAEREDAFAWLASHNGHSSVGKTLDVGSGADAIGMQLAAAAHPQAEAFGVELVSTRARSARNRGFNVLDGSAEDLPFIDEEFDLVTCLHTLEHCPNPDKALSEIERVLEKDGLALIVVPRESRPMHPAHLCCFPTERSVVAAVEKAGLVPLAVATVHVHKKVREIRVVAQKPSYSDYVKVQVAVAPGHPTGISRFVKQDRIAALDWLADDPNVQIGTVLDVGPRDGYIMEVLKLKGAGVVMGVELSPPAVRDCQSRGLDVIEGDIRSLPFDDRAFDLVTCLHVLEHCPEPEKAMSELWRVVRPGGCLFVVVPIQNGTNGKKKGAHYSYFQSEADLCRMVEAVTGAKDYRTAIATNRGINAAREIRFAARKATS